MSLSRARLAALDEHLRVNYIENQRYPGVLTGIYRHGELVHASPLGFRDIDNTKPVERLSLIHI